MKGLKRLKQKKKHQLILAVMMILLLAIGFFMNTKPLYVGFAGGLSGHWSQLGVQTRDGFLQAVKDINATGGIKGRPIVPIILDDRNDNDYTHYLLEELSAKDIKHIIGFSVSAMTPSIQAYGQDESLLFISPTMSSNELTGIDDQFIRICSPSLLEADVLLQALSEEKKSKVAILYDLSNSPYTAPMKGLIEKGARDNGLEIVYSEGFYSKNVYFGEIVNRINEAAPDQILLLSSAVDTAEIAQRLNNSKNEALVYACAWATTNDLLGLGGTTLEGMRVVGLCDIDSKRPEYLSFQGNMRTHFNSEASFPQVYGYEAMMVLKEGIERANSFDPVHVKEAIIGQETFSGLQEDFSIDAFGDAKRSFFIYTVKEGQYEHLK